MKEAVAKIKKGGIIMRIETVQQIKKKIEEIEETTVLLYVQGTRMVSLFSKVNNWHTFIEDQYKKMFLAKIHTHPNTSVEYQYQLQELYAFLIQTGQLKTVSGITSVGVRILENAYLADKNDRQKRKRGVAYNYTELFQYDGTQKRFVFIPSFLWYTLEQLALDVPAPSLEERQIQHVDVFIDSLYVAVSFMNEWLEELSKDVACYVEERS